MANRKPKQTLADCYKRIGVKPAEARTVTLYSCPDCGPEKGKLVSHLGGKAIERKRNWPNGYNYFACKNCQQPLWVEIESWD